jgi:hypothetical protein
MSKTKINPVAKPLAGAVIAAAVTMTVWFASSQETPVVTIFFLLVFLAGLIVIAGGLLVALRRVSFSVCHRYPEGATLRPRINKALNNSEHVSTVLVVCGVVTCLVALLAMVRDPCVGKSLVAGFDASAIDDKIIIGEPERPTIIFSSNVSINGPRIEWMHDIVLARDNNNKEIAIEVGTLGKVEVGMLWNPYKWVIGSTSQVGIDEKEILNIEDAISSSPASETRPIIAVGMASSENSAYDPGREEARAGDRADRLVSLCQRRYPEADIHSLNLGFFRRDASTSISRASERRVVLMVVTGWEEGADLNSGARDALLRMAEDKRFSFDARNYSNFAAEKFQIHNDFTRGRWNLD